MSDLSILCVSRLESYARPFIAELMNLSEGLGAEFVLVLDGEAANNNGWPFARRVWSGGFIESVLDDAIQACANSYILRIDDDERCSKGMVRWLSKREYEVGQHWKFPRVHFWGDDHHVLATPELWPDHQTRLSWKQYAGNRRTIHAGSPHGGGLEAPCAIEHHKFLVRPLEERRLLINRYDAIEAGAGSRFRAFSAPEDFYTPEEMRDWLREWDGEGFSRTQHERA